MLIVMNKQIKGKRMDGKKIFFKPFSFFWLPWRILFLLLLSCQGIFGFLRSHWAGWPLNTPQNFVSEPGLGYSISKRQRNGEDTCEVCFLSIYNSANEQSLETGCFIIPLFPTQYVYLSHWSDSGPEFMSVVHTQENCWLDPQVSSPGCWIILGSSAVLYQCQTFCSHWLWTVGLHRKL